ncbi:MAG: hypothetical protein ACYCZ6_15380 [Polaromonas sp.]
MNSLVTTSSTQHPVSARMGSALDAARQLPRGFSGARGLATLLLSAMAAAIMVVAYQVMDSVAEGHLLVIWITLWAVAFAVLALFAGAARNLAARLKAGLDGWSLSLAQARADQRMWAMAKTDYRLMADLQAAMLRAEAKAEEAQAAAPVPAPAAPITKVEPAAEQLTSTAFRVYPYYFI